MLYHCFLFVFFCFVLFVFFLRNIELWLLLCCSVVLESCYTVHTGLYKSLYGSALPNTALCHSLVIVAHFGCLWSRSICPNRNENKSSSSSLPKRQGSTINLRCSRLCATSLWVEKDPSQWLVLPAVPWLNRGSVEGHSHCAPCRLCENSFYYQGTVANV